MIAFTRDGISFQHPSNWRIEVEESDEGGWGVLVSSPETAFALVSLRPDATDPAHLADETLEALKADYKELDAENRVDTIAGQVAIGHDIDFLTLDTPITCRTRCLATPAGPLVVLCQFTAHEQDSHAPVLQAVVASLTVDEE